MVILQFNKIIRNKWLWGAIAVLFCLMFVGSDLVSTFAGDRGAREGDADAGSLGGEPVSAAEFAAFADDVRGHGQGRDMSRAQSEVNRDAWEHLATYRTAERDGVAVSDALLGERIHYMFGRGGFDFNSYRAWIARELSMTPEAFEASLRRRLVTDDAVVATLVRSAVWASPMETDQLVADRTDEFTVSIARFVQDKAAADAITVDEAGLKAWYDKNVSKLALPELAQIRFIRYNALAEDVLARMVVTEDDMRDQYDANVDKYTSTDTNGVDVVKSFEEVRGEIESELRKVEAINFFETNLTRRAYATATAEEKGTSRLEKIAAEDGASIVTSGWFALDGSFNEGFTVRPQDVLPGATGFLEAVSELDPDVEDLRYAVVRSDDTVWLVERSGTRAAHTPSFEEAKDKIGGRALADAKAEAFKASVEAISAQGVDAVLASGDVTNGVKFVVADMKGRDFDDQLEVVDAATKLRKGEVSPFVSTGVGTGLLVVCTDRVPGDAASITVARAGARDRALTPHLRNAAEKWPKWNLDRLGFKTTAMSSVESESTDDEEVAEPDEEPEAKEPEAA